MKLRIHTQISTVQPLKFGNGKIISSHSLLIVDFLSMLGLTLPERTRGRPWGRLAAGSLELGLTLIHIDPLEMLYQRPIQWKCLWAHDINLIRMCYFNMENDATTRSRLCDWIIQLDINTKIMSTRFDIWACKIFCEIDPWYMKYIMTTSSNGNIFRVTGHLCGEFTDHRWISHTKASDAEIWCFLWSAPEYTVE